ncbi:hypothetical protein [Paenibacillus mendelii]|uniref:Uncharacterized protein n=1 Tax=Paenibacillus mendelii TaxID=206163 RepID=A0ABV6JI07_9BACL|nr:hypothetical protein [Paenibacillus mendelii]MCQ6558067.1 hypothetical protein [Paenibacillus mendelii]
MSRMEKFGSRRATAAPRDQTKLDSRNGLSDGELPSRRIKHPSNKKQMTQWLYRAQIVIYLMLVIGLLMWGKKMYGL